MATTKATNKPAKFNLDAAFIAAVRSPILGAWQEIAMDVADVSKNDEAIELCIDADRLSSMASTGRAKDEAKAADKLISDAIASHGYPKVLKFLSKNIRLV